MVDNPTACPFAGAGNWQGCDACPSAAVWQTQRRSRYRGVMREGRWRELPLFMFGLHSAAYLLTHSACCPQPKPLPPPSCMMHRQILPSRPHKARSLRILQLSFWSPSSGGTRTGGALARAGVLRRRQLRPLKRMRRPSRVSYDSSCSVSNLQDSMPTKTSLADSLFLHSNYCAIAHKCRRACHGCQRQCGASGSGCDSRGKRAASAART